MRELPKEIAGRVIETDNGCWEWQGYKNPTGYGQVRVEGKLFLVHRLVYLRVRGWFKPHLLVMHSCDNPACCNPAHLSVGTDADNIQDAVIKGRMNSGEANGQSKLSSEQVTSIRALYDAGESQAAIARKFNVNRSCIWKIVHRFHWSNNG